MKKFMPLLFIALFFSIQVINAQNAPISTIGNVETYGTTANVPITVTNFTNIGGCDLLFNYDPAVATVTSVTLGPGIGQFFFGSDFATPGLIAVTWIFWQPGVPGQSLPDNSVFLNITFEKANYGYSAVEFNHSLPDNCLWVDEDVDELNDIPKADYYFDGSVTFSSNNSNTVYGNVTYANGANSPLSDVTVTLMDGTTPVVSDLSDANGDFEFLNIPDGTYRIESSTVKTWGGLTMNDAQYTRQYVTGQPPGNGLSGLHLLAADVDLSSAVTMNDVQFMRQKVTSQLPGFTSFWIFEEPNITVSGGSVTQDFKGICGGDTDGSYIPPVAK